MMLGMDVQWQPQFDFLVPRWGRCMVKNRTRYLGEERWLSGTTVDELKNKCFLILLYDFWN